MSLTITVNGGGTFTASMEEGPVSFTASLAAVGPQGPAGAAGATGVVAATAPIVYTSGTQTVSMDTSYFVRSPAVAGTDTQILSWDGGTSRPLWIDNQTRALFMLGTNKTGTTIAKGKAVYVSGATGNHPEITLAQANSELSSASTIGITSEEIANNGTGKVIVSGRLENVNTNAFAAGDTLYLSPTTAGGFTTTFPTQPDHGVLLGYVTRANANTGVIEVVVKNYQELEEQSDVLLTSKANGDFLVYESATSLWKNRTLASLDLLTATVAAATYQTQAGMSAYLTTSSASSTYAPIASPTFTGTVTIPAGASISGFAPLASPALTGTPTAPTAAASTNSTQIATTAFVQQEVPAASTTVAGKVELATDAEAEDGTSTTLAITPATLKTVRLQPTLYNNLNTWTAATSGTTNTQTDWGQRIATGTTSGNNGSYRSGSNAIYPTSRGQSPGVLNFSVPTAIGGLFNNNLRQANVTWRFTIGKNNTDGVGDLTRKGYGIRAVDNGALVLQVHNGTTLTSVTSSFTLTANSAFDVLITNDGAGNVTLFVNGSSVATSSDGPTGTSATTDDFLQLEARADATLTTQSIISISRPFFYQSR
jgi:hypothetical protein